jgi:hypothetical protein
MAKLNVITDGNGKLLAAVRSGPVKTSDGKTVQFVPHPNHKHQEMEVDDRFLSGPATEVGRVIRERLK